MFTGLIADLGEVRACERDRQGAELEIATPLAGQLAPGDSIAVNGVCLTATAVGGGNSGRRRSPRRCGARRSRSCKKARA